MVQDRARDVSVTCIVGVYIGCDAHCRLQAHCMQGTRACLHWLELITCSRGSR